MSLLRKKPTDAVADLKAAKLPAKPAKTDVAAPVKPPSEAEVAGLLSARKSVLLGGITSAVLVFGFGLWAVFSEISGAIVASGQLEVSQSRQIVQHPDGGVVAEIAVKEAQQVQAGDLLIRLDGALVKSELAIVEGQLFEVMARSARLTAERDDAPEPVFAGELAELAKTRPEVAELIEGQRSLFIARRDTVRKQSEQLQKRSAQIAAQIEGVDAQVAALSEQLALIEQELTDQRTLLEKGLAQSSRVLALEREASRLQGSVGELQSSRAQAEGRATEVELEVLRLAAVRREEANTQLRDIGAKVLELAERRRALTEQTNRLEIRAPVSGTVLGLAVTTPRSVIRPADPVLYLIPQDRPLVINAQVQTIHVDEVHVGQKVRLMFPAFSSRTTPELWGHVVSISADALVDERAQMAFYKAEIKLDPGEAQRLEGLTLIPGMPVEAFIETGARSPMAYLLKPFTDYFVNAFRES
ncbi:MAG: HlyD family type I secretion periplasmic adaptor subunit [Pseudorhodobacter sp.]|nr:MAG: HlyD family type I secretion periplasmic adaptor subunit [Pseudorhodobacter sp.]